MARVDIDADVGARLARSPGVRADMLRRGQLVQAAAQRTVHVDPDHDPEEGPHLRDAIYCVEVGDEVRVGSDKPYALAEELLEGGEHAYLRPALDAARDR